MNTIQSLLSELQIMDNDLVSRYLNDCTKFMNENQSKTGKDYFELLATEIPKALATNTTHILHKSIVEGYEDRNDESLLKLITGAQDIGNEAGQRLMNELRKK